MISYDLALACAFTGTGAVKVTPAHDPNDFLCGRRHGLPEITIFTDEGAMAAGVTGSFAGMMRLDARVEVLKQLKDQGFSRGEAVNKMRLGKCSRTGDIIEPMLKPQWWVDCSSMAKRATDAVRNGELRIQVDLLPTSPHISQCISPHLPTHPSLLCSARVLIRYIRYSSSKSSSSPRSSSPRCH